MCDFGLSFCYKFINLESSYYLTFTGIGDGGNEVGMGKVYDKVVSTVPNGATIACKTASDYLVTSGLCDWGGYALSMALYLLRVCPIHERYQRRAVGFPPSKADKARYQEALLSVDKVRKCDV